MNKLQDDRETVSFFMYHLDQPCGLSDGYYNIISFYIREAKRILPTVNNPNLRKILEKRLIELY